MFHTDFVSIELESAPRFKDNIQVVDQFDGQPFNFTESGFPRNLVSQIMKAESEEIQEMLLKRLVDVSKGQFEGMTNEEICQHILPRSIQTAASCREWLSNVEDKGFNKALKAYTDKFEKEKQVVEPSSPVVEEPSVKE